MSRRVQWARPNSSAAVRSVGSPPRASQRGSKTTCPAVTPERRREAQMEGGRGSQLWPPGLQTPEEAQVHESHTNTAGRPRAVVQLSHSGCGPWSPRPRLYGRFLSLTWGSSQHAPGQLSRRLNGRRSASLFLSRGPASGAVIAHPASAVSRRAASHPGPDPGASAPLRSPHLVSSISTTSPRSPHP